MIIICGNIANYLILKLGGKRFFFPHPSFITCCKTENAQSTFNSQNYSIFHR